MTTSIKAKLRNDEQTTLTIVECQNCIRRIIMIKSKENFVNFVEKNCIQDIVKGHTYIFRFNYKDASLITLYFCPRNQY